MVVEHEPVSLSNPRQGEPPFTGDGLSQALYRVLVPPTHVLVHWVQLPHEPQFPFTNRKMIGVVDEGWYYDFSSLSTADFNKISNICWFSMLLMYCTQYQRMLYYNNSCLSKPLVILMAMINGVTSVLAIKYGIEFHKIVLCNYLFLLLCW
jgi:hypothetical protein